MLTDFVVAAESDAVAVAGAKPTAKKWPRAHGKDLDEVKLGRLWEIVRSKPARKRLPPFRTLHAVSDEGPWVFAVPQELVEQVGSLDDAGLGRVAGAWAECEEFGLDGWEPADVEAALTDVRAICRRSGTDGKPLLLWMCM